MTVTYSLIEDNTQSPLVIDGVAGNLVGTPAALGPLVDNASLNGVPTHALLGPLGIGAADPNASLDVDGRGLERPGDDGLRDLGSHESDATNMLSEDLDGDGDVDCDDMDIISMEISSGGSEFDLNQDGTTDIEDLTMVRLAGMINHADFNCDGFTDVSDFGIWNQNKFTMSGKWSDGDANLDGFVDVSDFGIWNTSKFTSFESRWSPIRAKLHNSADSSDSQFRAQNKGNGGAHLAGAPLAHFRDAEPRDIVAQPPSDSLADISKLLELRTAYIPSVDADVSGLDFFAEFEGLAVEIGSQPSVILSTRAGQLNVRNMSIRATRNVDQVFASLDSLDPEDQIKDELSDFRL